MYKPQPFKDVTLSPEYNFSSFTGTVWKTKVKVAIVEVKLYTGAYETCLRYWDEADPDYIAGPDDHIVAELAAGARLRIRRLTQDQGVAGFSQVEAVLEDGTNAQKEVYLDPDLLAGNKWSGRRPETISITNWGVNPDMLEAAETP